MTCGHTMSIGIILPETEATSQAAFATRAEEHGYASVWQSAATMAQ
jgi:hypothetical protein